MRLPSFGVLFCGVKDIARRNKLKVIIASVVILIAFGLGIANALSIEFFSVWGIQRFNMVALITGRRTFFGYFLMRLLGVAFLLLILSLCALKPVTAWFSLIGLFVFGFNTGFFVGAMFIHASISVLPVIALCVIPAFLLFSVCFIIYFSAMIEFSCHHNLRCRDFVEFVCCLKKPFLAAIAFVAILSLVESILAAVLTLGIVL